ncbi:hypothetical protein TSUD_379450 [Trifolium subterraneum]|uniref:Reverse transcriptase zinc-binding domain-containing protein n=1 Tax=Trifolium subterraneum TaxID=3900 RepID=A0A2Z6N1J2_TRISU|nr:hypothetical protein TSUD_379450 [Trifolium subterraneum]
MIGAQAFVAILLSNGSINAYTTVIEEACVENLWTTKAILRWFELISGLKVNFFKSKLFGINVEGDFLSSAAQFLKCNVGKLSFIYLGLPVGANPRRLSTWNPVLDVIQKRLASWKNKYVSLGGRVVLLNSVLAAIPIFYLSLFKMPVGVWKKLVGLQRRFLWGGAAGASKISWVNWLDICRPKKEGGLGVKDLRIMNISLLTKWKWRLLSEVGLIDGLDRTKDLFFKRIGNGGDTRFWHDTWVGAQPLKEVFPRLFLISSQKECSVLEVGRWVSEVWEWNCKWRRSLFVWEEELADMLDTILTPIQLSHSNDEWRCHHATGGRFSVSSLYCFLSGSILPPISLNPDFVRDLGFLWKSWAPSKVVVFSWQLLRRRLPTRENLGKRGICDNGTDSNCVLCPLELESEGHLFCGCAFASTLWTKIFKWFGLGLVVPSDPLDIFHKFSVGSGKGKRLKGFLAVWHAVVWAIWRVVGVKPFDIKGFQGNKEFTSCFISYGHDC